MNFYKFIYFNAGKILDAISMFGINTLDNMWEVSRSGLTEQFKTMKKEKDADDEEIV